MTELQKKVAAIVAKTPTSSKTVDVKVVKTDTLKASADSGLSA